MVHEDSQGSFAMFPYFRMFFVVNKEIHRLTTVKYVFSALDMLKHCMMAGSECKLETPPLKA